MCLNSQISFKHTDDKDGLDTNIKHFKIWYFILGNGKSESQGFIYGTRNIHLNTAGLKMEGAMCQGIVTTFRARVGSSWQVRKWEFQSFKHKKINSSRRNNLSLEHPDKSTKSEWFQHFTYHFHLVIFILFTSALKLPIFLSCCSSFLLEFLIY
jgi:hypothetical protein